MPWRPLVSAYFTTARANILTVGNRLAIIPSRSYPNGIWVRDAFYTALGLGDLDLSEQAYRWFEMAQDPETGQIATAVPFDPADTSLKTQDDESTLLFVIWSGVLRRAGRPVNPQVITRAWGFVQGHVQDGLYVSAPGAFRYWADCWQLSQPDVIAYNQGLYVIAARFIAEMGLDGASGQTTEQALQGYRDLYRADLGFMTLSKWGAGRNLQDVSALFPEFLHRHLFGRGMSDDAVVIATTNHRLATATVRLRDGSLVGVKNIAHADGAFVSAQHFACPTLRKLGDYQNGGHWPLFTTVELALAHSIEPLPVYREAIASLIWRELRDGRPKEYWGLQAGRLGAVEPGRSNYAWNALIVPALRMAELVQQ